MAKPKGKSKRALVKANSPAANTPNPILAGLKKPKPPKPPKPIKQIGPALALSGGAAHGDFEVGVVRYLYEKGLVPKIICGTSVGAVNALKLAEGEPGGAAIPDGDGHLQGLAGLIAIWRSLRVDGDMYTTLDPCKKICSVIKSAKGTAIDWGVAGFLLGGSLFGPIGGVAAGSTPALISLVDSISEIKGDLPKLLETRSFANLDPLVKRMKSPASFKESFVEKSRIALRLVMVALEDGALRMVDEHGALLERDGTQTQGDPSYDKRGQDILKQIHHDQQLINQVNSDAHSVNEPGGPKHGNVADTLDLQTDITNLRKQLAAHQTGYKPIDVGLVEAALASAALPVSFPPQLLPDGRYYVDGGTRMVTPIEAAWRAGASQVFAVVASMDRMKAGTNPIQKVTLQSYAPPANVIDIALRVGGDIEPSEINDDQLLPPNGWPIPVIIFRPRWDIHDSLTIDPGLIDIRMDQGWMCGDDVMQAWARDSAGYLDLAETFDRERGTTLIATFRHKIWIAEFAANGLVYKTDGTGKPVTPGKMTKDQLQSVPGYLENVRSMKQQLQQIVQKRLAAGGNVPPNADHWWLEWERHSWTPNRPLYPLKPMAVTATPTAALPFHKPVTIEVTATSAGKPVPGAGVFVNQKRVGSTGKPIKMTFAPRTSESIDPGTHLHQTVTAAPDIEVEALGFATTPVPLKFIGVGDPTDPRRG